MKASLFLNLLLFFSLFTFAQLPEPMYQAGNFFYAYSLPSDKPANFELPQQITAFCLLSKDAFPPDFYLKINNKSLKIVENTEDEIQGKYAGYHVSALITLDAFDLPVQVEIPPTNTSVLLHAINGHAPRFIQPSIKLTDSSKCGMPKIITPDIWRAGLPDPKPNPSYTKTEHVVIHHSAGSNVVSDPVQRIRNIYILHTQTNGWDDIGYNFLIVPDGSIYQGRDGQNSIEADFVKGAHFCGKNSYTMGICMVGTYSNVKPSDTAIQSLIKLISWKLFKDQLHPLGTFYHPHNNGYPLDVICGHRDGCSTECPGDSLYALFPFIRNRVLQITDSCGGISNLGKNKPKDLLIYPVPASVIINIDGMGNSNYRFEVISMLGKTELTGITNGQIRISSLKPGMYLLNLQTKNATYKSLIIKR